MSGQMHVSGDQWPIFLYLNYTYDEEDPWNGLLRSGVLSFSLGMSETPVVDVVTEYHNSAGVQTYLHVSQLRRSRAKGNEIRKC